VAAPRRALLSVSDKDGLVAFAAELKRLSFEILSTGGTAGALRDAGIDVLDVSTVTGFPEIMDGRVKTLHPAIHAGLLARDGVDEAVLVEHGIGAISLLVVNLYPFEQVIADPGCSEAQAIENIDVGGPAMLRAAAKNHARLTVVVDKSDYEPVLTALRNGEPAAGLKRSLAVKAFAHTAAYDAAISRYLHAHSEHSDRLPERLNLSWQCAGELRYGENPHQQAALYTDSTAGPGQVVTARQRQGKPLSFNNLMDADTALQCAKAFTDPACVIVKHANPCGVATAADTKSAYIAAFDADQSSAFGGVIAFNRPIDADTATAILERQFVEVVVAPTIVVDALPVFAAKSNLRVLEAGIATQQTPQWDLKSLEGGILLQQRDSSMLDPTDLKIVSTRAPTDAELKDMLFAWTVVRFVKSNAIVYAAGGRSIGIGAGQMSRVMSARIATMKAEEAGFVLAGAAMASDAFFPFTDSVEVAAKSGISAIIQPGGSMRDEEIIAAANELGVAMAFTGQRHFRH